MKTFKKIMTYILLPITVPLTLLIILLFYILLPFDWFSNFAFIRALRGEENNESNNDNR